LLCPSTGVITPSTAQYPGATPAGGDQRGGSNVTPETGSLMDATGTRSPRTLFEQSVSDTARSTGVAAVATCTVEGRSDATSTSPNVTARLRVAIRVRKLINPWNCGETVLRILLDLATLTVTLRRRQKKKQEKLEKRETIYAACIRAHRCSSASRTP
jgi:hypothetical protein